MSPTAPRRYLALHFPLLAAERAIRAGLAQSCFVIVAKQRGAMRIVDWTKEASGQNAAAKELETSA